MIITKKEIPDSAYHQLFTTASEKIGSVTQQFQNGSSKDSKIPHTGTCNELSAKNNKALLSQWILQNIEFVSENLKTHIATIKKKQEVIQQRNKFIEEKHQDSITTAKQGVLNKFVETYKESVSILRDASVKSHPSYKNLISNVNNITSALNPNKEPIEIKCSNNSKATLVGKSAKSAYNIFVPSTPENEENDDDIEPSNPASPINDSLNNSFTGINEAEYDLALQNGFFSPAASTSTSALRTP